MPVLLIPSLSTPTISYPLFAILILFSAVLIIYLHHRKQRIHRLLPSNNSHPEIQTTAEKSPLPVHATKPRIPSPLPSPPTHGTLASASSPITSSEGGDPLFQSSPDSYSRPSSMDLPSTETDALGRGGGIPRRRSYTRTLPEGSEVSGEIVVAEGWRRHTRVFGGGVCKACEESERRMTA